jgi:hypothetical protein
MAAGVTDRAIAARLVKAQAMNANSKAILRAKVVFVILHMDLSSYQGAVKLQNNEASNRFLWFDVY